MTGDTRGPLSYKYSDGHLGASWSSMCDLSENHYILIMMDAVFDFTNVRAWI